MTRLIKTFITLAFLTAASTTFAADTVVNAEARIFKPDTVYIELGDTVKFHNMTSHNAVSYVKPEGSAGFGEKGKLPGGSLAVTPDKEGIYGYACEPHVGFGMVGVIVVGNVTQDMKDAAMADASANLQGPFKRIIGKIKKIEVK